MATEKIAKGTKQSVVEEKKTASKAVSDSGAIKADTAKKPLKADASAKTTVKKASIKDETVKTEVPKQSDVKKTEVAKPSKTATKKEPRKVNAVKESAVKIEPYVSNDNSSNEKEVKTVKKETKSPEKEAKKVLFVTAEALPFAATGGLGEVAGSLPRAINEASKAGYDVRVIMPFYTMAITDEQKKYITYEGSMTVNLAWRSQYCGLFSTVKDGVKYYFIDNEYYFKRNGLYGHYDDGERFAFFSKAVLEVLPMIEFFPNILHCNDWQTALVPVYYKLFYMYQYRYENIKTIFTIHNIEYQGKFGKECMEDLFGIPMLEYDSISDGTCINLMKGAIDYADSVTTVSPTYAKEILSDYFAHGLAGVLTKNQHKLAGILNGIDTDSYNSSTDKALFKNFDENTLDKKVLNKLELQKMLNLPVSEKKPMIAIISRLVAHKGIDLVKASAHELLAQDVQLVVLGTGNAEYEAFFSHLQVQYPNKLSAIIAYNKDLSRKIYAACDMFLMPSKSEPCGLSQMIASRYASVPLVRETGGLYDSIKDCNDGHFGNGYTFATYNSADMLNCIKRALGLYNFYPQIWRTLMKRIINTDFSWNASAQQYLKLYGEILG